MEQTLGVEIWRNGTLKHTPAFILLQRQGPEFHIQNTLKMAGMVEYTYDPSTGEAETGASLGLAG